MHSPIPESTSVEKVTLCFVKEMSRVTTAKNTCAKTVSTDSTIEKMLNSPSSFIKNLSGTSVIPNCSPPSITNSAFKRTRLESIKNTCNILLSFITAKAKSNTMSEGAKDHSTAPTKYTATVAQTNEVMSRRFALFFLFRNVISINARESAKMIPE